jgi:peptidyl-prolyl cis-trans isomerase C
MKARTGVLHSLASAAALLVLASGAPAQTPANTNKPIAVVDGTPISAAEVEAVLKQAPPTPQTLTEAQRKQMQMEAVGMLIDDLLLEQYLRKTSPKVAPEEVNRRFGELQESLKKQNKTMADFCKETGQNEAQLRSSIATMIQWGEYVRAHMTEADLKKYYDEYKDYFDRVGVRASHIVLRVPPSAPEKERTEAQAKLQALRADIVAGKTDFGEAAKKYSQCSSAPAGGDVGYFPRKMAVEEAFAKAAFALKVGEVSDVVQTDYGMHLIKVTDRKPGQPSDYNKIKEEVRELYIVEMRLALLEQLRKTAKVEVNLP